MGYNFDEAEKLYRLLVNITRVRAPLTNLEDMIEREFPGLMKVTSLSPSIFYEGKLRGLGECPITIKVTPKKEDVRLEIILYTSTYQPRKREE